MGKRCNKGFGGEERGGWKERWRWLVGTGYRTGEVGTSSVAGLSVDLNTPLPSQAGHQKDDYGNRVTRHRIFQIRWRIPRPPDNMRSDSDGA